MGGRVYLLDTVIWISLLANIVRSIIQSVRLKNQCTSLIGAGLVSQTVATVLLTKVMNFARVFKYE